MEVNIQEGSNSSGYVSTHDQPDNFNVDGWASFPEIDEKEPVKRVRYIHVLLFIKPFIINNLHIYMHINK